MQKDLYKLLTVAYDKPRLRLFRPTYNTINVKWSIDDRAEITGFHLEYYPSAESEMNVSKNYIIFQI